MEALCEAAVVVQTVGTLLGVGLGGVEQTHSSLGFILQCGVAMETASIVFLLRWLLQSGNISSTEQVTHYIL